MQVFDQQLVDVAVRRELHEIDGERHHQEDVDAQVLDELGTSGQCRQLRGVTAGVDHFHWVRVERHQHGRHIVCVAGLHRVRYQLGMSAVNSIEHADSEHTDPSP